MEMYIGRHLACIWIVPGEDGYDIKHVAVLYPHINDIVIVSIKVFG